MTLPPWRQSVVTLYGVTALDAMLPPLPAAPPPEGEGLQVEAAPPGARRPVGTDRVQGLVGHPAEEALGGVDEVGPERAVAVAQLPRLVLRRVVDHQVAREGLPLPQGALVLRPSRGRRRAVRHLRRGCRPRGTLALVGREASCFYSKKSVSAFIRPTLCRDNRFPFFAGRKNKGLSSA